MSGDATVAVLTAHWESGTEEGWIARQVAGALAGVADVHVVTPEGERSGCEPDSVFSLHHLGSPIARSSELRRDLLVRAFSQSIGRPHTELPPGAAEQLDRGLIEPWKAAGPLLTELRPSLVVVVDLRNVGALSVLGSHLPTTPMVLVPLGSDPELMAFAHFDPLFDRADAVLTVTESERSAVIEHHGKSGSVHRIGAPMAANPSALTEPNTWVGDNPYVLVLTGTAEDEGSEQNELVTLLRMRYPEVRLGIVHNDAFCVWHQGRVTRGWPAERASDLDRLMAWARMTVELGPGAYFGRRCVTSLLYGTPIVVPASSRAREHAELGKGGLWFADAPELAWCVEALLDPAVRTALGGQGRTYAEREYASTERFVAEVVSACGKLAERTGSTR